MTTTPPVSDSHRFHGHGEYEFCPDCRAERAEDAAGAEADNVAEIDRLTCDFADSVIAAKRAVWAAQVAVKALLSDQVYDVEMAEGAAGGDALYELEAAERALRNAERIAKWRRDMILEADGIKP